jgi:hypothetical protein
MRALPGGCLPDSEKSLAQDSRLPTFNWRHSIDIADAGGQDAVDSRAASGVIGILAGNNSRRP